MLGRRPMPTRADTDSMRPTLESGGSILVDFAATRPRVGELWVFQSKGEQVVHRYLGRVPARTGWSRRFRGDNRPTFDPPVRDEDLRGHVVAIERGGRWWSLTGPAPALYALGVALHDHLWGAAIGLAERVAQVGGASHGESPVVRTLVRVDRTLLRWADRCCSASCTGRPGRRAGEPRPARNACYTLNANFTPMGTIDPP